MKFKILDESYDDNGTYGFLTKSSFSEFKKVTKKLVALLDKYDKVIDELEAKADSEGTQELLEKNAYYNSLIKAYSNSYETILSLDNAFKNNYIKVDTFHPSDEVVVDLSIYKVDDLYDLLYDLQDTLSKSNNLDEGLNTNMKFLVENELEKRHKKHKKTIKPGAMGSFIHPDGGNKVAIDTFNNSVDMSSVSSTTLGESLNESYDSKFKDIINYIKSILPKDTYLSYDDYRVIPDSLGSGMRFQIEFDSKDSALQDKVINSIERKFYGVTADKGWGRDWDYYVTIKVDDRVCNESLNEDYAEDHLKRLISIQYPVEKDDNIQLFTTPRGNYLVKLNGKSLLTLGKENFRESEIEDLRLNGYFTDYDELRMNGDLDESIETYINKEDKVTKSKFLKEFRDYPVGTYIRLCAKGNINDISQYTYGKVKTKDNEWAAYSSFYGIQDTTCDDQHIIDLIDRKNIKNIGVKLPKQNQAINEALDNGNDPHKNVDLGYIKGTHWGVSVYDKTGNIYLNQYHPYDNAPYCWAYSTDKGKTFIIVRDRKVLETFKADPKEKYQDIIARMSYLDKNTKSRMLYDSFNTKADSSLTESANENSDTLAALRNFKKHAEIGDQLNIDINGNKGEVSKEADGWYLYYGGLVTQGSYKIIEAAVKDAVMRAEAKKSMQESFDPYSIEYWNYDKEEIDKGVQYCKNHNIDINTLNDYDFENIVILANKYYASKPDWKYTDDEILAGLNLLYDEGAMLSNLDADSVEYYIKKANNIEECYKMTNKEIKEALNQSSSYNSNKKKFYYDEAVDYLESKGVDCDPSNVYGEYACDLLDDYASYDKDDEQVYYRKDLNYIIKEVNQAKASHRYDSLDEDVPGGQYYWPGSEEEWESEEDIYGDEEIPFDDPLEKSCDMKESRMTNKEIKESLNKLDMWAIDNDATFYDLKTLYEAFINPNSPIDQKKKDKIQKALNDPTMNRDTEKLQDYIAGILARQDEALEETFDDEEDYFSKLQESAKKIIIPKPYNKYFEVDTINTSEDDDYKYGDKIDGYDCHFLACLMPKDEDGEIYPILTDDPDYPVCELVGGRLIPVDL